jgi:hypothetical protein
VSNEVGAIVEKKGTLLFALLLPAFLVYPCASFANSIPVKAATPLSADEVAIYKAILQSYANEAGVLNVDATTVPLDFNSLSKDGCLQGIQLENIYAASHSFHELPPEILAGTNGKLVDEKTRAKNGRFSLTEIAFDKDRRYAVVNYGFWRGSLGDGRKVVFEKANGVWRDAHRSCLHLELVH